VNESDGARFRNAIPVEQETVLFGPCQDGGKSAVISMNIPKHPFAPLDKDGNYVADIRRAGNSLSKLYGSPQAGLPRKSQ
jgi:hypothetical protein